MTNARAAEARQRLKRLLPGLRIEGFERSFKMVEHGFLWDRFLAGVEKRDIGAARLLEICDELGMPADQRRTLTGRLPAASQVLFGFEAGENHCIYKIYLEFWEKVRRGVLADPGRTEPTLLHMGFKWDAVDARSSAVAEYTCFPMLDDRAILARMSAIHDAVPGVGRATATLEIATRIFELASSRAGGEPSIYIEVAEEGNPRRSFDLNLYKANLRVDDVYDLLSEARRELAIPADAFDRHVDAARAKLLGHVAGGISRDGTGFLTAYYEDTLEQFVGGDARVGRNSPCPCGSGKKFKKCCGG